MSVGQTGRRSVRLSPAALASAARIGAPRAAGRRRDRRQQRFVGRPEAVLGGRIGHDVANRRAVERLAVGPASEIVTGCVASTITDAS